MPDANSILIQLTSDDYLSANRLHARARLWWIFSVYAAAVLMGAAVVGVGKDLFGWLSVAGLAIFMALVFLFSWYVVTPRQTRRIFAEQKNMQRPYTLSWDDNYLSVEGENFSDRESWSDFARWRENDQLFAIYHSDVLFRIVPKRAFPEQSAVVNFRELLRAKIAPVAGQKRT